MARRTLGAGVLDLSGRAFVWGWAAFNSGVVVWLVLSSLKTSREILNTPFALPTKLHFDNYTRAWDAAEFGTSMFNTVLIVVTATLGVVAMSAPASYALAKLKPRLSAKLTAAFAVGIGIPLQATFIPLFVAMSRVGLTDSLWGLWLLYVATSLPFTVFLMTGFFRTLPQDTEEAAAIDGASPARTFFTIVMPMARPGLVTAFLLNLVTLWSETLLALVFLSSTNKFTLARSLWDFYGTMTYTGDWSALLAGVCIVLLPILALYAWLGTRMIEGLTLGMGK